MFKTFFELIQVALGNRGSLTTSPSDDVWIRLFKYAEKQCLLGICFVGITKLPKEQAPFIDLLMEWTGQTEYIRHRNSIVDKQSAEIWKTLNDASLDAAVLKGQGIGLLYGDLSEYRQSGDIDVWVRGGFSKVNEFVQRTIPSDDIAYHRFHYNAFKDTEVELHHRPTLMRNLFDDRKLQRWCNSIPASSFIDTDKGFAVPPLDFNRVFILTHIYRHFLFEGIGLRQVMDYYFVLKSKIMTSEEKLQTLNLFKEFRITRFAAGMMWILKTCYGLDQKYLICEPNQKEGAFILSEILQTGNFGMTDNRYVGLSKWKRMLRHSSHLLTHYPSEVVWTPIWLVYHKFWRRKKLKEVMIVRCKLHNSPLCND